MYISVHSGKGKVFLLKLCLSLKKTSCKALAAMQTICFDATVMYLAVLFYKVKLSFHEAY